MAKAAAFSLLMAILLILLFSHAYSWWMRAHACAQSAVVENGQHIQSWCLDLAVAVRLPPQVP